MCAPKYEKIKSFDGSWWPTVHMLSDSPQQIAVNELLCSELAQQVSLEVASVGQYFSKAAALSWFDRRFIAISEKCAQGTGEHLAQHQPIFKLEIAASDENLLRLDSVEKLVACYGGIVPKDCFSAEELETTRTSSFRSPSGDTYLICDFTFEAPSNSECVTNLNRLYRDLSDRWPIGGWGYLRKLDLLSKSSASKVDLINNFPAAFLGFESCWQDSHFFEYALATLVSIGPILSDQREVSIALFVARSALNKHTQSRAIDTLLTIDMDLISIELRSGLHLEIANLLAQQREPFFLEKAESHLESGLDLSKNVPELQARLLNVLALVRYHQVRNEEALSFENRASDIAFSSSNDGARIWAASALLPNTAQLLERRFGRTEDALWSYLEAVRLSGRDGSVRPHLNAARLLLKDQKWGAVKHLLTELLNESRLMGMAEESLVNLMLALAFAKMGELTDAKACCSKAQRILNLFPENHLSAQLSVLQSELQAAAVEKH
jgi:tetratricopeptide (TPR) repeat protein